MARTCLGAAFLLHRSKALNDDVALSSLEREIRGGLVVMGIDMSKGKQVAVRLVHATSESPQSAWSAMPSSFFTFIRQS